MKIEVRTEKMKTQNFDLVWLGSVFFLISVKKFPCLSIRHGRHDDPINFFPMIGTFSSGPIS
jgi:hypothetical protein